MQLKKRIEKLETDRQIAIEEVKQQVHEEKERKDGEILRLRSQAQSFGEENTQLKERIEKLEIASTNQLEKARANQLAKARAIFKRLKAEKSEAIAKGESRLKEYGNKMKVEKENLQKQGNDFQNMEREVNQLQMRLAQSEEIMPGGGRCETAAIDLGVQDTRLVMQEDCKKTLQLGDDSPKSYDQTQWSVSTDSVCSEKVMPGEGRCLTAAIDLGVEDTGLVMQATLVDLNDYGSVLAALN
ncbi:hypothetical protein DPMN_065006 [Dreissena polymorpha]|uniref:Uncharacterized protein n=1 Tax=Dreissena polymorpha TaxID=45954 RepID=A0A9D4HKN2_DREPO|nr:hypothetical protein DPMN_065006 [Dreissena polymorpha]